MVHFYWIGTARKVLARGSKKGMIINRAYEGALVAQEANLSHSSVGPQLERAAPLSIATS